MQLSNQQGFELVEVGKPDASGFGSPMGYGGRKNYTHSPYRVDSADGLNKC